MTDNEDQQTIANTREFVIVGRHKNADGYVQIGYLTPDIDIEPYLFSLGQAPWEYQDVHIAEKVSTYGRPAVTFIEANRRQYPDEHRHMAKTTRRRGL